MKMSLFSFHNEFDDVDVLLDDESIDSSGPFTVEVIFNAPEIKNENEHYKFATLREAQAKFLELVQSEIGAVLDDGSFT